MKHPAFLFLALVSATSVWGQLVCDIPAAVSPIKPPSALIDVMTGQPLAKTTTKCIVLVHGWNPGASSDCYDINHYEFFQLLNLLGVKLKNTGWSVVAYDWHEDAATGDIWQEVLSSLTFQTTPANQAAANAVPHGDYLATTLDEAAPDLREVHFIAHSAGTHAAKEAMTRLLQLNHYVIVQATFLDPYIPCPANSIDTFSDFAMDQLQFVTGNDRIQRLENYFADDSPTHGWNAFPSKSLTGPTVNTQELFNWRSDIDINQEVEWGTTLVNPPLTGSVSYSANYDWHSGPVQFYADTVYASIPGNVPSSSLPAGSPYDYRNIGWNRSLYTWEANLPQITTQPADQTIAAGETVSLSVVATGALSIDWYVYSGTWVGSGPTLTLNNFTAANPRVYVARLRNDNGQIYSRPVMITVGVAAAPTITSVSPSTLTGLPIGQRQLIRIIGSGFTAGSTLLFNDESQNYNSDLTYLTFVSANEIDYKISTGTAQADWSVQVVNDGQPSNKWHFTVTPPSASTGSLIVNLSPPDAVLAGAQWQVDGTGYNDSGQAVGYLIPGTHTVSFKSVPGYDTPANHSVVITAGEVATHTATYIDNSGTQDPLTIGLLAYYSFDGNATNRTGNGFNGIVHSAILTNDMFGNPNSAYSFDGHSYISVADPGALLCFDPRNQDYSVSLWAELDTTSIGGQTLIDDRATGTNCASSYSITYLGPSFFGGSFAVGVWDGIRDFNVVGKPDAVAGQWYNLALVVRNAALHLYINGIEDGTPTSLPLDFLSAKNADGIRSIGRAGPYYGNFSHAAIDNVRVYNRALSNSEILQLYNLESHNGATLSPRIQAAACSAGKFTFDWTAIPGRSYQVQYSENLTQGNWTNSGSRITATDSIVSSTFGFTNQLPLGFYRVVLVQ